MKALTSPNITATKSSYGSQVPDNLLTGSLLRSCQASCAKRAGMHIRCFISSPHGDMELAPQDLEQPFLLGPADKHPFLTLKDYFGALQNFILSADGKRLDAPLAKIISSNNNATEISEILICSEKHGAFYHIASISFVTPEQKYKFALTTALTEASRAVLQDEFSRMQQLAAIGPDFLPQLHYGKTVTWQTESGVAEFYMVLGQWLDDYHEWHLSNDPTVKGQIQLWDYQRGYRFLSAAENYKVLRQAAYILTCFYDQATFCQIYPWHHGAGDFVVKAEVGTILVKLITVRQYKPLVHFELPEESDRLVAAIQFLLNLSLRIRLDRLDGTGEPVWFEDFAVHAAVEGFLQGLAAASASNKLLLGPIADFMDIMRSFEIREIYDMYESLLEIYADEDQEDFLLIRAKLADHAAELHAALQNFSLGNS